jgi:hypothetical protein
VTAGGLVKCSSRSALTTEYGGHANPAAAVVLDAEPGDVDFAWVALDEHAATTNPTTRNETTVIALRAPRAPKGCPVPYRPADGAPFRLASECAALLVRIAGRPPPHG